MSSSCTQRIIRNIKLLMVVLDVKQADLAQRSGLSESQLSRLLSGKRAWSLDHMEAVATALNVSVVDLLSEADHLLRSKCFSSSIDQLELFANGHSLVGV